MLSLPSTAPPSAKGQAPPAPEQSPEQSLAFGAFELKELEADSALALLEHLVAEALSSREAESLSSTELQGQRRTTGSSRSIKASA